MIAGVRSTYRLLLSFYSGVEVVLEYIARGVQNHLVQFHGGARRRESGAENDDYRGAGGQVERRGLLRVRHPRPYFLGEMRGRVPEVAQSGIDTAGAGVGLGNGTSLDQVGRER